MGNRRHAGCPCAIALVERTNRQAIQKRFRWDIGSTIKSQSTINNQQSTINNQQSTISIFDRQSPILPPCLCPISQRLLSILQLTRMALVFTAISNSVCATLLSAQYQARLEEKAYSNSSISNA